MTPALLRHLAGPGAVLAARPRGVAHVVSAGPLTRSGGFIPRARRSVCRAHTGRLAVVDALFRDCVGADRGADRRVSLPRVCARCSARLLAGRRAEPQTRDTATARWAGVTLDDLAADLPAARTEADVDRIVLAALTVHGITGAATLRPFVFRHRARTHVATEHELRQREEHDLTRVAVIERGKADRKQAFEDRERRIADLGINNVKPNPAPIRTTRKPSKGARR